MYRAFAGFLLIGVSAFSSAQTAASGIVNWSAISGGFHYDIRLNNTGTTNIRTLWFGWRPGQNYMTVAPTNVTGPAGWDILVTHGAADGWGIRWNGAPNGQLVSSGNSLSGFSFTSTMSPAQLASNTPFFDNPPTTTTWVYETAPFQGGNFEFVAAVNPVPEPATMAILGLGSLFLLRRRRKA